MEKPMKRVTCFIALCALTLCSLAKASTPVDIFFSNQSDSELHIINCNSKPIPMQWDTQDIPAKSSKIHLALTQISDNEINLIFCLYDQNYQSLGKTHYSAHYSPDKVTRYQSVTTPQVMTINKKPYELNGEPVNRTAASVEFSLTPYSTHSF